MKEEPGNQGKWQRLARKVAGKVNAAWWLEKLGVPLVVTALVASCLILLARRELDEFPLAEALITGGILLLAMVSIAWWTARRHFESPEHAMVRIEASMKLRNSLTAARHGATPWPSVPETIDDGTRWHWRRLLTPVLAAALFLTASVFLPVSAKSDPNAGPPDQPQAWKDIEADIETLSEDDTVQEQYLEELEDRLEELREQKEDEWFSHSSLEATDSLKKAHGAEVENLERNLRNAERALNALQKHGANMGEGARQRLLNEFENAVQGMNNGAMKPNKELLNQLQHLDPAALNNLTPEQLQQLRDAMKNAGEKCEQCEGGGGGAGNGGGGDDWLDELLEEGNGEGQDGNGQEGPNGEGPGRGGVNRGPGTAPGVLGKLGGDIDTGDLEGLEGKDLSRSLPGDLLELQDGEHEIDKTQIGPRAGGGVAEEGTGGDRIWKDSLLPDEKKALRQFFK